MNTNERTGSFSRMCQRKDSATARKVQHQNQTNHSSSSSNTESNVATRGLHMSFDSRHNAEHPDDESHHFESHRSFKSLFPDWSSRSSSSATHGNSQSNGGGSSGSAGFRQRRYSTEAHGTLSTTTKKTDAASARLNIWTRLIKQKHGWSDIDLMEADEAARNRGINGIFLRSMEKLSLTCVWIGSSFHSAFKYQSILFLTVVVFAVICAASVMVVILFANSEEERRKHHATHVAEEAANWFSEKLNKALIPLHGMSLFVQQLPEFQQLPIDIGQRGQPNAAPPLQGKEQTHRNVSGIVPEYLSNKFHQIASGVKNSAELNGVIVSVQLAPQGVVTLIHPVNNTEDFDEGIYLDNTAAIGHDLLNDPRRVAIARDTVSSRDVVTAGPLTLIQGDHPVVRECFIARLAIRIPDHDPKYNITIDDISYECWGFAVVLINWEKLKSRSNIYHQFEQKNMFFRLTRTDRNIDTTAEDDNCEKQEVVIAQSENAEYYLKKRHPVSVLLDTTDNEWVMHTGYKDGWRPAWEIWGIVLSILGSLIVSIMFMLILVSKKEHEVLLFKMMPLSAIRRLRRGKTVIEKYDTVTIFFSDIVGFTSMAGEMSPLEVMSMLNDLYTEFDELVKKHDVYKVETIGDAYMVLGGAPKRCIGPEGAEKVALFALDVMEVVHKFRTPAGAQIYVRAGLASGPVVAGVVGTAMPRYCFFGDTVNLASRMESTSLKMKIQCHTLTTRLLRDAPKMTFGLEERREGDSFGVEIKGKGRLNTFWITGAQPRESCSITVPDVLSACEIEEDKAPDNESRISSLNTDAGEAH